MGNPQGTYSNPQKDHYRKGSLLLFSYITEKKLKTMSKQEKLKVTCTSWDSAD